MPHAAPRLLSRLAAAMLVLTAASACSTATLTDPPTGAAPGASGDAAAPPSGEQADAAADAGDAGAAADSGDGAPVRVACTSSFGDALTRAHGRLDGELISIVPEQERACNGDTGHVHLQVKANGGVYDVAVNTDTLEADVDATALPGGAWAEGWHDGVALDYAQDLGLHSSAFTGGSYAAQRARIESALAEANHVAIFATGYGPGGAHLVHRKGGGSDGAIVVDPLSAAPRVMAFRFAQDSF